MFSGSRRRRTRGEDEHKDEIKQSRGEEEEEEEEEERRPKQGRGEGKGGRYRFTSQEEKLAVVQSQRLLPRRFQIRGTRRGTTAATTSPREIRRRWRDGGKEEKVTGGGPVST